MAEELEILVGERQEVYKGLLPQIKSLIEDETNEIANLSNIAAALRQSFGFFWVGFCCKIGKIHKEICIFRK